MKTNSIIHLVLGASILISCDIMEFPHKSVESSDIPINFGTVEVFDSDPETKSGPSKTVLSSFKSFRVYCSTFSDLEFSTKDATVTTSSVFTSSSTKYYPKSGSLTFYASNAESVSGTTVTLSSISRDIVWATGSGSKENTDGVTLAFKHAYTRIAKCGITGVNTTGGTVTVDSVMITPNVRGKLNLGTGAWTDVNAGAEVKLNNNGSSDNEIWAIPGSYTVTVAYTVTQGAYTNTGTTSGTVSLDAGKNNTINGAFSISESGITEVKFKVSVEDWTDANAAVSFK